METAVQKDIKIKEFFPFLHDRSALMSGIPQRYGTQYNGFTMQLFKLENPEKVNEWRATIGLPPLSESEIQEATTMPPKEF